MAYSCSFIESLHQSTTRYYSIDGGDPIRYKISRHDGALEIGKFGNDIRSGSGVWFVEITCVEALRIRDTCCLGVARELAT